MITLVDLSSVYWPAWFATKSAVGAYEKAIDELEYATRADSSLVIACCDSPVNKRKMLCESYKAQRPKQPDEAYDALRSVQQRLADRGVPMLTCEGYEGEDVIATLCAQAGKREVQIVGVDKDLYALLSETVCIVGRKGRIDANACYEKWGVVPSQMTDFLAMVGDASDNIEGCPSCGPGRAADLLSRFESIEGIRSATDKQILSVRGIGKKTLDALRSWDPTLALSLVRLMTDAPVSLRELVGEAAA